MAVTLFEEFVLLFQMACVVFLFTYLFAKSRFYTMILEHRASIAVQVFLAIVFGLLSVYGMSSGIRFYTATVNIRDFGPMAAGLACGPFVGLGAGIIAFLYRLSVGGTNVYAVAIGPLTAGIVGGLVYYYSKQDLVSTKKAVIITAIVETVVSAIAIAVRVLNGNSTEELVTVTVNVALPMIIMTTIAVGVFCIILHNERKERRIQKEKMQLELEVASKKNLNTIINTMAYPVYVIDRDHRFILANDSMCRFVGRAREDIIGKTHRDFYSKAVSDLHWDMVETAFDHPAAREETVTITKPDGQVSTIISSSTIYTDTSGQKFMVWVIQDITDKKHAEEILRESEERFSNAFHYAPIGVALVSLDGHWLKVNQSLCDMIGYSENELSARTFQDLTHPDDIETDLSYVRQMLAGEIRTYQMEKRYFHKSGQLIWALLSVSLVKDQNGSPLYFISQIENITERKLAEDALAIVNRKLNLLSSITRHDILNKITVILLYLGLAEEQHNDPTLVNYLGEIRTATREINSQINFTQAYQDLGIHEPQWADLDTVIQSLQVPPTVTLESDVKGVSVYADQMLEKVFFNLLDNSIRHGQRVTGIRVSFHHSGGDLTVIWEDNGTGIAAGEKERIFERGFGKNTGLGLFLTREILSITGITITENGEQGRGARFEITVPKGAYRLAR